MCLDCLGIENAVFSGFNCAVLAGLGEDSNEKLLENLFDFNSGGSLPSLFEFRYWWYQIFGQIRC